MIRLTAALLLCTPAAAQEVPTLTLSTRIVAVAAVVRAKDGHPVGGLAREDFELRQDGKPQEFRYFSQGSELPLTLTLLVDTSGSQHSFLVDETAASRVFFKAMLKGKDDRAALVQFDNGIVQLQPMTADIDKLERGLGYLSYQHPSLLPNNQPGTLLYDTIVGAAGKLLGGERGRRAMVLLTDGGDNGSHSQLADALAAVQKADISVYSVFYSVATTPTGTYYGGTVPQGRAVLEKLSEATGGKVFNVNAGLTLRQIYAEIEEDLRLQYQLGYRPPDAAPGSYHRIELRAIDKHLQVQSRRGFYTP